MAEEQTHSGQSKEIEDCHFQMEEVSHLRSCFLPG
nr:MAG TPA: hypothetical protein [Caudoviricetes sp.]